MYPDMETATKSGMTGLWHYKIGIIMTVIALWHVIKRLSALRNSLKP